MNNGFVPFDEVFNLVVGAIEKSGMNLRQAPPLYLVRDLFGKVRLSVSEAVEADETCREDLHRLAGSLHEALGAHGYPPQDGVLFVDAAMLEDFHGEGREMKPGAYWVDRMVTGNDWWTVGEELSEREAMRCTLFSVKGGVGRSTTAAVLAWHLARKGERVLVVDLDLESPGLSSAMLDARARPEFGVTDWFVEDLVGQGDRVIERMVATPAWAQDLEGTVRVVPAHGDEPGEYLAKLGRVYMDTGDPWTKRLESLLSQLERTSQPSIVLLESRSGLHDIAATTVTDLGAEVLLFAIDSESHWTDYDILFRHWQSHELATTIRERLSIVSALTPELDTKRYLQRFRERSWDLFQELYDEVPASNDLAGDFFSFDLNDEEAPHHPLPIHWTRGLAAGTSLRDLELTTVEQAYQPFFRRFDELVEDNRDGVSL